nr:hypothetical protein Iba_chr03aCG20100 [Ipomoea batatas]
MQKVSRSRVLRANEADYYWSDEGDRSGASMMFELERSWPHVSEIVALGGSTSEPSLTLKLESTSSASVRQLNVRNAAQAIEFSVGCQARWSSFVVKSNEFPFASPPGLSEPTSPDYASYATTLGSGSVVASILPAAQPKTRNRLLKQQKLLLEKQHKSEQLNTSNESAAHVDTYRNL